MSEDHSITLLIADLKQDQDVTIAQQEIWRRYFRRLAGLAKTRLGNAPRRVADEEDVVVSALSSFFSGIAEDKFPQLTDRESLWPLLAKITARKAINQRKFMLAAKRSGGQVRGESALLRSAADREYGRLDECIAGELTPEYVDDMCATVKMLLRLVDGNDKDGSLREIVLARMRGSSTAEIAQQLGVVPRTVQRKTKLIQDIWVQSEQSD